MFKPFAQSFISLTFLFVGHMGATQNVSTSSFKLHGSFNGMDSGAVSMMTIDGDTTLYTTILSEQKFLLEGDIKDGDRFLFNIMPGNWNFRAFVEPGNSKLYVDTSGARHVKRGNPNQHFALIWEVQQEGSHFFDVEKARDEASGAEQLKKFVLGLNKRLIANDGNVDSVEQIKSLMDSANGVYENRKETFIYNYILQHTADPAGPFLLNDFLSSSNPTDLSHLQKTFNAIESPATQSKHYAALQQKVEELLAIKSGSIAPDFTAPDSLGNLAGMVNYKNKYLLIDFWASWCGPCRKAIPMWKELYKQYQPQGFEIVAISTDTDRDDWLKALRIEKMPWRQLHEPQPKGNNASISDIFRVHALPTYVLVDEEGKIVMISGDSELVRDSINDRFKKRE